MIDLASDTVTKPTPGMREAMAAEVGDDVYRRRSHGEQLEEQIAELLGKEAAAVCPFGDDEQPNRRAAALRPGDEVLCERSATSSLRTGGPTPSYSALPCNRSILEGLLEVDQLASRVPTGR